MSKDNGIDQLTEDNINIKKDLGYISNGEYGSLGKKNDTQIGIPKKSSCDYKNSSKFLPRGLIDGEKNTQFEIIEKINAGGDIKVSPVTMIIDMDDFQAMRTYVELLSKKFYSKIGLPDGAEIQVTLPINNNILEMKKILDKYEYMEHEGFPISESFIKKDEFEIGMRVINSKGDIGTIANLIIDFKNGDNSYLIVDFEYILLNYDLKGQELDKDDNCYIIPYKEETNICYIIPCKEETKEEIGFDVGMLVEDSELGKGTICEIIKDQCFPIRVLFSNNRKEWYNKDGIAFRNGPEKQDIKIKLVTE